MLSFIIESAVDFLAIMVPVSLLLWVAMDLAWGERK
jgi:hypothetical protein